MSEIAATLSRRSSSSDNVGIEVPPPTPASNLSFGYTLNAIPQKTFANSESFQVPYIREKGVKTTLEILGVYLGCADYKHNPIQFWFLDVVADCLWRMQDEFQFPDQYQKIIIEWMVYVFELIRDPRMNFNRKKFFMIFNQTMELAEDFIQSECEILPSPAQLFSVIEDDKEEARSLTSLETENSETSSFSSDSDESSSSSDGSCIAVFDEAKQKRFKLPKKLCIGDDLSEPSTDDDESSENPEIGEEIFGEFQESSSDEDFYKPDLRTPPRFKSLSNTTESSKDDEDEIHNSFHLMWKSSVNVDNDFTCASKISTLQENTEYPKEPNTIDENEKQIETVSVEIDANQFPSSEDDDYTDISSDEANELGEEWTKYLEDREELVKKGRKNVFLNCCALFAIKQFVVDYFYESFQFTLIRLALIGSHNLITQKINSVWNVPKIIRDLLKKPKIKKDKKKKKKKKKKKPKKKKKDKKKKKKDKKSKNSKKSSKKSKKSKRKKLTKAEKAELARLRKEQKRLEEEKRLAEMNRRLLFPLQDAADDEFYKSIFENWVKPKKKKGKKKGKKGKKGKKTKK